MIEWIKFKGTKEEDRKLELPKNEPFLLYDPNATSGLNIYETLLFEDNTVACPASFEEFDLMKYDSWAPLNLPAEEKWGRKINFLDKEHMSDPSYFNDLYKFLNQEFDNIYSILNELRKR